MAIQKQPVQIPFGQGLDTKTDEFQVPMGKFLRLDNVQFDQGGQLRKRYGFPQITTTPTSSLTTLTTLNDNLVAVGQSLYAYDETSSNWTNQGLVQPVSLETEPLVRTSLSQTVCDSATDHNGAACVVYTDSSGSYYKVIDSATGQTVVAATRLEDAAVQPRVVVLGNFFIIAYMATVAAAPHLRYIAVGTNRFSVATTAADIATTVSSINTGWDIAVANNYAYICWNGNDGGGAIHYKSMSNTLALSSEKTVATEVGDLMAVVCDTSVNPARVWIVWYKTATTTIKCKLVNFMLTDILTTTSVNTVGTIIALTGTSVSSTLTLAYQISNTYSYSSVRSDYINYRTVTAAGTVSSATTMVRSVGLASKAFLDNNNTTYMLTAYAGTYEPSYFLMNLSGNVILRLAYQNGTGYATTNVLPSAAVVNDSVNVAYLTKTTLVPVNKTQGASAGGIYNQTGVNLAKFGINSTEQASVQCAGSLYLTGGQIWQYDGVRPVEQGFHLYPEDCLATITNAGGNLAIQQYYYQVCYEWTDGQGNLQRSAPSIPISANVTGGGGNALVTLKVPTLRVTYKQSSTVTGANYARIVIYRWSTGQPVYYQITSISSPVGNDTTVDNITYVDTLADASILGNAILYTTGGVLENIGGPPCKDITIFKNRVFVVDSEDGNVLWYSKQVLQNTPVEMCDLQTIYVPPTFSSAGTSGPVYAINAMDDKLIIFKKNSIFYVTGNGPDATGSNNDFSEPTFVTGIVGTTNHKSVVLTPMGLMFQSDKGIWLLGRDLSTKYIGADVEGYNNSVIVSAASIPGTNQSRFVLDNGTVLMYDYYYSQWSTFSGLNAISGTLYQSKHTVLNAESQVLQETTGSYIDGANPVLISFTTAWIKLLGLQGYQRALYMYLLGTYKSPHTLQLDIAYDYDPAVLQSSVITPLNSTNIYGADTLYGGSSPYGGSGTVEQFRCFFQRQQCQSLQITCTEQFDASKGLAPGAGLTLSGINLLIGAKARTPKLPGNQSVG